MKIIGILTSGADCQALNAAMRGVIKSLDNSLNDLEIYGFLNGFKGLIFGEYRKLTAEDFSGILTKGGTIIGNSREPFKQIRELGENGLDKVKAMKETYRRLELECLVVIGGRGSQKTANLLREEGVNIIYLPKAIDNDIFGTDVTLGFQSAVEIDTSVVDCVHTTAASDNRIFVIEITGHEVGWLALHAGIAGGADIILIPEIPYDMEKIMQAIDRRSHKGRGFTIIVMAKGARSREEAQMSKKDSNKKMEKSRYPSPAYELAEKLSSISKDETRVIVPGHMQRGGSPCPSDRVLSARLGSAAAGLIIKKEYGNMVAMVNNKIQKVPLEEVAGRMKMIDPESPIIIEARRMGICFGD